ncbi:DUF3037 domain-containing protein [Aestuariibaculum sp. YM273]|uniref:DUF3037 domain-containing protein n=1 Tax=Aestuariibaculum sp. YM273 TaxID=3070659 RepID=UPI0027DC2AC8|nr:DUF3037 domain-containing protein [Aestuariibaculum sp. YM273]WMI64577.1 DUF3037 domain-containing protein [Aestuariibaculum sp. YM273]
MQDRIKFEYAIIRLVPKVERGEFFNIGAIVYAKQKKFLGVKYYVDNSKLKAFCKDVDVGLINKYLEAWKLVCEGKSAGGRIGALELPDRFHWLTASRSTIIQSSEVHSGLCKDPEQTLEEIFEKFVL